MPPGEKKDSELANAGPLVGGETVAIIQNGQNLNTTPEAIAARSLAGSLILAKIENLNLKNAGEIPLPFIGDYSAANTLPFKAVVIPKGGAFSEKGTNAVFATASFGAVVCPPNGAIVYIKLDNTVLVSFTAGNNNGDSQAFVFNELIPALQNLGYGVDANNYPTVNLTAPVSGSAANGGILSVYIIPMTSATTSLIFNGAYRGTGAGNFYIGQVPVGTTIFSSGPINDPNFDSFLDEVIQQFTNLNYGVVDNRPGQNSIDLTAPPNTGASFNGHQVKLTDQNDFSYLTTALSAAFAGGITDPPAILVTSTAFSGGADATPFTEIYLKYCGQQMNLSGYSLKDVVTTLITGENWGGGILSDVATGKPIFKILGGWVASIVTGTLNDYFVDIYIVGDKLPPVVPLP